MSVYVPRAFEAVLFAAHGQHFRGKGEIPWAGTIYGKAVLAHPAAVDILADGGDAEKQERGEEQAQTEEAQARDDVAGYDETGCHDQCKDRAEEQGKQRAAVTP